MSARPAPASNSCVNCKSTAPPRKPSASPSISNQPTPVVSLRAYFAKQSPCRHVQSPRVVSNALNAGRPAFSKFNLLVKGSSGIVGQACSVTILFVWTHSVKGRLRASKTITVHRILRTIQWQIENCRPPAPIVTHLGEARITPQKDTGSPPGM